MWAAHRSHWLELPIPLSQSKDESSGHPLEQLGLMDTPPAQCTPVASEVDRKEQCLLQKENLLSLLLANDIS